VASSRGRTALKVLLLLLGLGVFGALVWQTGVEAILEQFQVLGWGVALFLIPSFVIYTLDTWGWSFCFRGSSPVRFVDLWRVRAAGESLNATLPAAYMGGEPVKALLLRRYGVSGADGMAGAIVGKTSMTLAQILYVLSGLGAAAIVARGENLWVLLGASGLITGLATLSLYLAYKGQTYGLGRLLQGLTERLGIGARQVGERREGFDRMDAALSAFYAEDRKRFWVASAIFFLAWVVEMAEVVIFFWLLGVPLGPVEAYAIASLATVVKAAGFFIPASLGAQEGGNVLLFLAFGLTSVTALTFSLLRRVRELLWIGIGLALLAYLGIPSEPASAEESAKAPGEPESASEPSESSLGGTSG
jgi:uncharacterized protein (TIRG00374 family)